MNIFYIGIGVFLLILGIGIIYDPILYDTKHRFIHDFTQVKWPFSIFLTLIGLAFLVISLRKTNNSCANAFLICSNCKGVFDKRNLSANQCPRCGESLESLEGFYERHPERKER